MGGVDGDISGAWGWNRKHHRGRGSSGPAAASSGSAGPSGAAPSGAAQPVKVEAEEHEEVVEAEEAEGADRSRSPLRPQPPANPPPARLVREKARPIGARAAPVTPVPVELVPVAPAIPQFAVHLWSFQLPPSTVSPPSLHVFTLMHTTHFNFQLRHCVTCGPLHVTVMPCNRRGCCWRTGCTTP